MKQTLMLLTLIFSLSSFAAKTTNMNQMTSKPANNESTQVDDLVRGELAAMKSYDQLISDTKDEKQKAQLQMIRKDHEKAVSKLSKYVAGKPELLEDTENSGPWGTFAKTWVKGGSLMGNKSAMKAIQQGEEHGINEYKEALKDESVNQELRQTIKAELLPAQQKHIEALKSFM